ncbi:hypothetical protein [Brevibacterium renqingii]|uniref:hypothetical protein n=1 Tax=Brevibacterium renqingii TaxID=2776916 RepID=UPI001ADFD159|nr:hypothetical protein [Brevibacterium renqingii]
MIIPAVFNRSAGATHVAHVVGTCFLVGGLFIFAWYLSSSGMLEVAATGLAYFAVTFARQMGVGLSSVAPIEFEGSVNAIRQIQADFTRWLANRSAVAHALVAVAYTAAFLLARMVLSNFLTAVANPLLAGAVGLVAAAAVASPSLIHSLIDAVNTRNRRASGPEGGNADAH